MKNKKKLQDFTDEELNGYATALKYEAFNKWAEGLDTDPEKKKIAEEIARENDIEYGSPLHMMIVAFFAGMDAGADLLETISNAKSPTSGATLTGQATN